MESDGIKKIFDTSWGSHYVTAYEIYKNNKLFGSGFKSFRNECKKNDYDYKKLNQKFNLNLKVSWLFFTPTSFVFRSIIRIRYCWIYYVFSIFIFHDFSSLF